MRVNADMKKIEVLDVVIFIIDLYWGEVFSQTYRPVYRYYGKKSSLPS